MASALKKSGSFEGRKALPKTNSFDNVDFMSAAMADTFIKGADQIKAELENLIIAKDSAEITKVAEKLADLINAGGVRAFAECGICDKIKGMLAERSTSEQALRLIEHICVAMDYKAEPFVVPFLPPVLAAVADKKSKEIQVAAEDAGQMIIMICSPQASKCVQAALFAGIAETNWQTKMWSLRLLGQFAEQSAPPSRAPCSRSFPSCLLRCGTPKRRSSSRQRMPRSKRSTLAKTATSAHSSLQ